MDTFEIMLATHYSMGLFPRSILLTSDGIWTEISEMNVHEIKVYPYRSYDDHR